jgi:muramoyltetrapeptide carboxypeptidase
MIAAIGRGDVDENDLEEMFDVLEGRAPQPWNGLSAWRAGDAHGRAAGGNLALIAALAGTPHALPLDDAVVFLEDVGERPYRVDRMLTTLRMTGAFSHARSFVLGDFDDCGPAASDGVVVDDALRDRLCDLGVPVLAGARFGHAGSHRVIPFGDRVTVRANGSVHFDDRAE